MSKLKTVDIKGKDYVTVDQRVKYFRAANPSTFDGWAMIDDVVTFDPEKGFIVIKTTIYDDKGVARATGIASETRDSSYINKTSYVENCETSAWGRALANLGIGLDGGAVCSAEELMLALKAQAESKKKYEERKEAAKDVQLPTSDDFVRGMNGTVGN